ncbi:MAG TPA: ATP-binding protein, partial [Burkholderiaceae bacterium]|nr:ATP-binding protein [Burkholderiaceae bacterium]
FGYPPQLRAMTLGELNALAPPHRRAEIQQALLALLKGQSTEFLLEHEMFDAHGRMLWVVTHARVAERNAQGRTVRMVGVTRDVTERRSQEDALRHAVEAANKANQAKADFLATMSHEIRTPINGVIGLARMLEDSPLAPQEAGYVRMINSCGNSLLALVNDVLDFSKIEAGQMVLEQIDTDLRELARETADVFASRACEKGVELIVRIAPEAPRRILADPHRLRQILLNLLGNALKFTATGAVTLRITAPLANGERRLRVDVTDTGIGIAADALPRLFRRFSQADASTTRRYQGTGLGLAISRDLAVLMGGDVTVTSTPGAGSTFTLDVPLRVAEQQHVCVAPPSSQRRPTGEMRVLLVEDNAINQMVALALLKKLGYTALTLAGDGEQALSLCAAECFDLVLMDCQMPVMNGFEATRRLRARGFAQPIVALTAGAVSQDREECLDAGMNDYVAKPIDSARLAATLERWLSVTA